jgi:hypothetical protein
MCVIGLGEVVAQVVLYLPSLCKALASSPALRGEGSIQVARNSPQRDQCHPYWPR